MRAIVLATHLHERIDHLVEQRKQLARTLSGKLRNELLALVAARLGHRHGILACEDHDMAHVAILGLDAAHDILLFRLNQQLIEGAKAHAKKVGHLLLFHLGLELEQVQRTNQVLGALSLRLGLLGQRGLAVTQQASSAVHLIKQQIVEVLVCRLRRLLFRRLLNLGLLGSLGYDLFRLPSRFVCLDALRSLGGISLKFLRLNGSGGLDLFDNFVLYHALVFAVLRHAFLLRPSGLSWAPLHLAHHSKQPFGWAASLLRTQV